VEARNADQVAHWRGETMSSSRQIGESEWQRKNRLFRPEALLGSISKHPQPRLSLPESLKRKPCEERRKERQFVERKLRQERKRRHDAFLDDLRSGFHDDLADA
jgi:hypothetical protein